MYPVPQRTDTAPPNTRRPSSCKLPFGLSHTLASAWWENRQHTAQMLLPITSVTLLRRREDQTFVLCHRGVDMLEIHQFYNTVIGPISYISNDGGSRTFLRKYGPINMRPPYGDKPLRYTNHKGILAPYEPGLKVDYLSRGRAWAAKDQCCCYPSIINRNGSIVVFSTQRHPGYASLVSNLCSVLLSGLKHLDIYTSDAYWNIGSQSCLRAFELVENMDTLSAGSSIQPTLYGVVKNAMTTKVDELYDLIIEKLGQDRIHGDISQESLEHVPILPVQAIIPALIDAGYRSPHGMKTDIRRWKQLTTCSPEAVVDCFRRFMFNRQQYLEDKFLNNRQRNHNQWRRQYSMLTQYQFWDSVEHRMNHAILNQDS